MVDGRVVFLLDQGGRDLRPDGRARLVGAVFEPARDSTDGIKAEVPVDPGDGGAPSAACGRGRVHREGRGRGQGRVSSPRVEAMRADARRGVDAQVDVERGVPVIVGDAPIGEQLGPPDLIPGERHGLVRREAGRVGGHDRPRRRRRVAQRVPLGPAEVPESDSSWTVGSTVLPLLQGMKALTGAQHGAANAPFLKIFRP